MSLLDPFTHALAALVATAHDLLAAAGADQAGGVTWVLSIAAVVAVVRLALLPATVHGVRQAHAAARARPQLRELTQKYVGRTDRESLRALAAERRLVASQHGMSSWGCLPVLVQLPIWFALYQLISHVAAGVPVGLMSAAMVASLGAATLLGVPLAGRGLLGASPSHLAVVLTLAVTAAALSYVTQRHLVLPSTPVVEDAPAVAMKVQQLLPLVSALGLLAAAGAVPVALLVYWVCNSTWTLAQSAVIWRWFPTPGSAAALRS